jgi:hypothetical protein
MKYLHVMHKGLVWNTLLDTHLVFVKANSYRALYMLFFPPFIPRAFVNFFYIQLSSIKHEFHQWFHCIQCIVLQTMKNIPKTQMNLA